MTRKDTQWRTSLPPRIPPPGPPPPPRQTKSNIPETTTTADVLFEPSTSLLAAEAEAEEGPRPPTPPPLDGAPPNNLRCANASETSSSDLCSDGRSDSCRTCTTTGESTDGDDDDNDGGGDDDGQGIAARIPPSCGRAETGLDCGRGSSYRHCNETQFIHGAPVQKQRVSTSSIIIIVVSTRSIVDVVFFGVIPLLLPAERVGGEVHARSIASEFPHQSISPLHERPRIGGSIPSPLEAYAIIILVITFVVIIVIVVIGIAIIATIAVVTSIKQLVDIQHAAVLIPSQRRQSSLNAFPTRKGPDMPYPILWVSLAPPPPPPPPPRADDDAWLRRREAPDVDDDDDDDDAAASPSRSGSGRVTDENSASLRRRRLQRAGFAMVENNFF